MEGRNHARNKKQESKQLVTQNAIFRIFLVPHELKTKQTKNKLRKTGVQLTLVRERHKGLLVSFRAIPALMLGIKEGTQERLMDLLVTLGDSKIH